MQQNYVYAEMWINIMMNIPLNDNFEGESPLLVKEEMTPSQIQKAKELARACKRKQYKDCEV